MKAVKGKAVKKSPPKAKEPAAVPEVDTRTGTFV